MSQQELRLIYTGQAVNTCNLTEIEESLKGFIYRFRFEGEMYRYFHSLDLFEVGIHPNYPRSELEESYVENYKPSVRSGYYKEDFVFKYFDIEDDSYLNPNIHLYRPFDLSKFIYAKHPGELLIVRRYNVELAVAGSFGIVDDYYVYHDPDNSAGSLQDEYNYFDLGWSTKLGTFDASWVPANQQVYSTIQPFSIFKFHVMYAPDWSWIDDIFPEPSPNFWKPLEDRAFAFQGFEVENIFNQLIKDSILNNISDDLKYLYKELVINLCLMISKIQNESFIILTSQSDNTICPDSEQIFSLIDSINSHWLSYTSEDNMSIQRVEKIYHGLSKFYWEIFKSKNEIQRQPCEKRIYTLLKLLPISAIEVLDKLVKLNAVKSILFNRRLSHDRVTFLDDKYDADNPLYEIVHYRQGETHRKKKIPPLEEGNERLVVKILKSFTSDESDWLMLELLKKNNEKNLFELLYEKVTDYATPSETIFTFDVIEEEGGPLLNRVDLCNTLFVHWKNSVFCPHDLDVSDGINPNSCWIQDSELDVNDDFIDSNIVHFNLGERELKLNKFLFFEWVGSFDNDNSNYIPSSKSLSYSLSSKIFDNEYLEVHRKVNDNYLLSVQGTSRMHFHSAPNSDTNLGLFHLFQPLVLWGYDADPDLNFPSTFEVVPAFLLYSAEKYDKLKDYKARQRLTVEISIHVATFIFTYGATTILALRWLSAIVRTRKFFTGYTAAQALSAQRVLTFFRYKFFLTEASLTIGTLQACAQYLAITQDSKVAQMLSNVLALMHLGTLGADIYTSIALTKEIKILSTLLAHDPSLPPPSGYTQLLIDQAQDLPDEARTLINNLQILGDEDLFQLGTKIDQLSTSILAGEVNYILEKFTQMTYIQKTNFLAQFGKYSFVGNDLEVWSTLNEIGNNGVGGVAILRWQYLESIRFSYSTSLSILTNEELYNKIILFFERPNISFRLNQLEENSIFKFIDHYTKPPFNLDEITLAKINNDSSRLELMITHALSQFSSDINIFSSSHIRTLIRSNLNTHLIGVVEKKMSMTQLQSLSLYPINVKNTQRSIAATLDIVRGDFYQFAQLSPPVKLALRNLNKQHTNIKIFQDVVMIDTIDVLTISGIKRHLRKAFRAEDSSAEIAAWIDNPTGQEYNLFVEKALDLAGGLRRTDSEMKFFYIFLRDILPNNLVPGYEFVITIESQYYTCSNCKNFYTFIKEYVNSLGMELRYEVISNKGIKGWEDVEFELN